MVVDVSRLRKAELHCHIDGLLDPAMVEALAAAGEPLSLGPLELQATYPIRAVDQWLTGYSALVDRATEPRERWLPRLLELALCPTSNIALGSVRPIEEHPIQQARARRLSFSINTDDPGPFACSMTPEMALVASASGFDANDFESIFDNTMRAAFRGR
jgi:adenosine deaminase